jgi:SpoVK/Ycf46/Vps4 family AAA+-type ATPase
MIKLFIYYTLNDNSNFEQRRLLAKLDPKCVELSFKEIREEGFSDDGLFDDMREFFLPLTITEHELDMERYNHTNLRQQRGDERRKLIKEIESLQSVYNEHVGIYWTYDEQLTNVKRALDDQCLNYLSKKSEQIKNTNRRNEHHKAELMQQLSVEWTDKERTFEQNINEIQQLKDVINTTIKDYERQLDEKRNQLENIEFYLSKKQKVVDEKLVKPHRGFIMFGPPGKIKTIYINKVFHCFEFCLIVFQVRVNRKL